MKNLDESILDILPIKQEIRSEICSRFKLLTLKKGEFFLTSGSVCHEMAYIESGYLRMYDHANGKEVTLWIGSTGKFITAVSSFAFKTVNHWNIQALTDCRLLVISRSDHLDLCARYKEWLEFDNFLLASAYAGLERNMFAQLHTTAQQRFETLMDEEPSLFNHVPLQFIASMLGITPETMSRLRKAHMHSTS